MIEYLRFLFFGKMRLMYQLNSKNCEQDVTKKRPKSECVMRGGKCYNGSVSKEVSNRGMAQAVDAGSENGRTVKIISL